MPEMLSGLSEKLKRCGSGSHLKRFLFLENLKFRFLKNLCFNIIKYAFNCEKKQFVLTNVHFNIKKPSRFYW